MHGAQRTEFAKVSHASNDEDSPMVGTCVVQLPATWCPARAPGHHLKLKLSMTVLRGVASWEQRAVSRDVVGFHSALACQVSI
jgi:hypothetical protein